MLKITKSLFCELNMKGIRYCVIKDSAYLKDGLDGVGDVEVLVHPEDIEAVQALLHEGGFKKFLEPEGLEDDHREVWIGFDERTGRLMSLHLCQDIVIPGNRERFVFLWTDVALAGRVYMESLGLYVVDPHLETLMLYIQLAQRAGMDDSDPMAWRALCGTASLCGRIRKEKMAALCSELFWGNGLLITDIVMAMVEREKAHTLKPPSEKELLSLLGKVERELKPTFYKVGSAEDRRRGTMKSLEKGKKVPAKEGLSICFIGADGSGKTTLSEDVEAWLAERIACRKFYMGNGDQYRSLSKTLVGGLSSVYRRTKKFGEGRKAAGMAFAEIDGRVMDGNMDEAGPSDRAEEHEAEGRKMGKQEEGGIRELVRYPLSLTLAYGHRKFAQHALKTIEQAEEYRKKGGIAIFDRYPQVQFEGIYDGPKISAKFRDYLDRELFRTLAKQEEEMLSQATRHAPSLVFRLLLPPEVSLQRKPDHDYENVRRKAEITEKLVFTESRDYIIDATQTYEKELLEVKRIIWESLRSLS